MTVRWAIVGAVIGAILGSVITAGSLLYISTKARQENTARELLSEVIALVSLKEGWLLQGEDSQSTKLSATPRLPETENGSALWLLPVEIRAVLDEAEWNSPPDQNYGFMQGRRLWIVRNEIVSDAPLSYSGLTQRHYPALISIAGMQELCGWIERVQIARNGGTLTDRGLSALRPYLVPLAQEDRVRTLRVLLSPDAQKFLSDVRSLWGKKLVAD